MLAGFAGLLLAGIFLVLPHADQSLSSRSYKEMRTIDKLGIVVEILSMIGPSVVLRTDPLAKKLRLVAQKGVDVPISIFTSTGGARPHAP